MSHHKLRREFLIKDIAISIGAGGGSWLPADDTVPPPSPISPIASVVANIDLFEAVRMAVIDAVKAKEFDAIGRAFVAGESGGSPVIRKAIQEIGAAVVASAAYAALGGGSVGLPNPDCGGTSLETIPPTLTPVVHAGGVLHRVNELPKLRHQLAAAVAFVEKAANAQAPRADEKAAVKAQLEGALKSL